MTVICCRLSYVRHSCHVGEVMCWDDLQRGYIIVWRGHVSLFSTVNNLFTLPLSMNMLELPLPLHQVGVPSSSSVVLYTALHLNSTQPPTYLMDLLNHTLQDFFEWCVFDTSCRLFLTSVFFRAKFWSTQNLTGNFWKGWLEPVENTDSRCRRILTQLLQWAVDNALVRGLHPRFGNTSVFFHSSLVHLLDRNAHKLCWNVHYKCAIFEQVIGVSDVTSWSSIF